MQEDVTIDGDPLGPRHPIYVVGLHRERPTLGPSQLDGDRRRLLRQRTHGVVLGLDADRVAEPSVVADQDGTRPGHGRLRRALLQLRPPTQLTRLSHPERIRGLTLNHHPAGHFVLKSGPLNGVYRIWSGCGDLNPGPPAPKAGA